MTSRITICSLFLLPAIAQAQLVPSKSPFSGLNATTAVSRIERAGLSFAGPRAEAAGMNAAAAVDTFPFLKLPNSPAQSVTRPVSAIKRNKPAFRLPQGDLGIADVQDVIFFTESRVVRVRLQLKVAGEPLSAGWFAQLKRYFNYLDRDGDGMLNAFEADFMFSNRTMQQLLQFGGAFGNPGEPGRTLADIDRDGDGKVSFAEFVAYYTPSAANVMRIQPGANRDMYADRMTDELFKLLDRDKDGKLSKAELMEAEKLLPSLDQNEDECLAALELVPNLFNQQLNNVAALRLTQPAANAPVDPKASLQVYRAGALPDSVVEQMLVRYDADKNLRLDKVESGLDEATFVKLDKNGDGELSVTELLAWKDLPADLSVEIMFNAQPADCAVKVLQGPDGKPGALADAVRIDGGKAIVRVGTQQIDLGAAGSPNIFNNANVAMGFQFPFQQADKQNKGYLIEKDVEGPQFQYLRVIFDLVDRDGDGRVTLKEYTNFIELRQSFGGLPFAVTYLTQSPSLFAILDANGDGRLSLRELRGSWERLKNLEPGKSEFITKSALKPQATIRFIRASQVFQQFGFANYNPNVQPSSKGPLWFRKMDRNNDGDVSRSEFPGRPEDFDKLDLDHDGLVSVEEAEAADKQFRSEKK